MATASNVQDTTQPANKYPQVSGVVTIEAPPLKNDNSNKPQLDLEAKSIRNTDQAWDLCKGTEAANRARSMRAAVMELEYSGQPPWSAGENQQKAQSWQSNVCTGVLAGIVDRKVLRFVKSITSRPYLTRSSLPTTFPDWKKKSDLFDIHTTRLIQSWEDYATFVNVAAKENVLHGYGFAVFLDPYTWKPKFFKQEIAYVPEQSTQNSKDLQFFVVKWDFMLHEFIELFSNEAAADEIGYNIPNCVMAAHNSEVKNPREEATTTEFRKFAEFIQDGVLGLTYGNSGPRVVKTYLLWNREYDGQVSFWIISRDDGRLLRFAYKLYKTMPDAVALLSFMPGNGHLHSSKGIGRMIIGNVKILEKMRNKMFDNVHMSSLLMLKSNSKDRNKLQPIVAAPFIVLDSSIDIPQMKFEANWLEYAQLDQRLLNFMEQSAGAYITPNPDNSQQPKTATEESIDSQREQENQDMTESRWVDQFTSGIIQQMQVRAYSDDNINEAYKLYQKILAGEPETVDFYDKIDEDKRPCVRTIIDMLKDDIDKDEIRLLRVQPASGYAHTDDGITANGMLAVKKGFTGNPNIDQVELDKRSVEALAGPDAAKALIIPQPDQTVIAEASRMQLQESATMAALMIDIPVSPRDNHLVHGEVCVQMLTGMSTSLSQQPDQNTIKNMELNLNHLGSHLEGYLGSGGVSQNQQFKQLNDFYRKMKVDLQKAASVMAAQQVASQAPTPEMADQIIQQAAGGSANGQAIGGGGAPEGTVAGGTSPYQDIPDNVESVQSAPPPAAVTGK